MLRRRKEFECAVCMNTLEDARVLKCGHSICARCARRLTVTAARNTIKCPECRVVAVVPASGLSPNYKLNQIVSAAAADDEVERQLERQLERLVVSEEAVRVDGGSVRRGRASAARLELGEMLTDGVVAADANDVPVGGFGLVVGSFHDVIVGNVASSDGVHVRLLAFEWELAQLWCLMNAYYRLSAEDARAAMGGRTRMVGLMPAVEATTVQPIELGRATAVRCGSLIGAPVYCAVECDDGSFHRAVVIELSAGGCAVVRLCVACRQGVVPAQIQFIDSGEYSLASVDKLRTLPDEFRRLPGVAVRCRLAAALPTAGLDERIDMTIRFSTMAFRG